MVSVWINWLIIWKCRVISWFDISTSARSIIPSKWSAAPQIIIVSSAGMMRVRLKTLRACPHISLRQRYPEYRCLASEGRSQYTHNWFSGRITSEQFRRSPPFGSGLGPFVPQVVYIFITRLLDFVRGSGPYDAPVIDHSYVPVRKLPYNGNWRWPSTDTVRISPFTTFVMIGSSPVGSSSRTISGSFAMRAGS